MPRKRKQFTRAQILRAARRVAAGERVADVAHRLGISPSTYSNWRRHYGVVGILRRAHGRSYRMVDLCRQMDLTRRAIAGYVQDGLLQPPSGFGSSAFYQEKHLLRLKLLGLLKRAGMTQAEMPEFLARLTPAKEKAILRAAGKAGWGAPRIREWLTSFARRQ